MPGYVDPFANRSRRQEADDDDPSSTDATTPTDEDEDLPDRGDDEVDLIGLDAVADDAERGRREAPFADDPAQPVRSV